MLFAKGLFIINAMVKVILHIQARSFMITYVMCLHLDSCENYQEIKKPPVNTSYIHFQTHTVSIWKCELFVILYCWLFS